MTALRFAPFVLLLACQAPTPTTLLLQNVPADARRADLLFLRSDVLGSAPRSIDIPADLAANKRELSLFLEVPAADALRAYAQVYDQGLCLIADGSGALQDGTLPIPLTDVTGCPNGGKLDPVLQKLTPGLAAAEDGAPLTLDGVGFQPGAQVLLNDQPLTNVQWLSPRSLKAQAPKLPGALGKPMRVAVVNPDGGRSERADLLRYYERYVRFEKVDDIKLPSGGWFTTGDLDQDGWTDLISAGITQDGKLVVMQNQRAPEVRFAASALVVPEAKQGSYLTYPAVADLDGDGYPEATHLTSGTVWVHKNRMGQLDAGTGGDDPSDGRTERVPPRRQRWGPAPGCVPA